MMMVVLVTVWGIELVSKSMGLGQGNEFGEWFTGASEC